MKNQSKSISFYLEQIVLLLFVRRLRNVFMLAILLLLFMTMAGFLLASLGVPYLYWHDQWIPRMLGLLGVGLFLEEWVFVAILLDNDRQNVRNLTDVETLLESEAPQPAPETQMENDYRTHLTDQGKSLVEDSDLFDVGRNVHTYASLVLCVLVAVPAMLLFSLEISLEELFKFGGIFSGKWFEQFSAIAKWNPRFFYLLSSALIFPITGAYVAFFVRRLIHQNSQWFAELAHRLFKIPLLGSLLQLTYRFMMGELNWKDDHSKPGLTRPLHRIKSVLKTLKSSSQADVDTTTRSKRIYGPFRRFHQIAIAKNSLFFAIVFALAATYWLNIRFSFWPKESGSVALIASVLFTIVVGFYGRTLFQRSRSMYEVIFIAIVITSMIVSSNYESTFERVEVEANTLPQNPMAALEAVYQTASNQIAPSDDSTLKSEELPFLKAWHDKSTENTTAQPILVVIANTGGGIKAQLWSTIVLNAIENKINSLNSTQCPFHQNVRLVTGTSGGMVGASYWVSTIEGSTKPPYHREGDEDCTSEEMIRRMGADCLTPVSKQFFYNDFLGFPINLFRDRLPSRGNALEESLVRNGQSFGKPVANLKAGEEAGWRPSLAFAPTVAEDGRRFLISNLPIEYTVVSKFNDTPATLQGANPRRKEDLHSIAGYSWRVNYPDSQMTVATAARLNANFPLFVNSPYLPFEDKSQLRILDGGYLDNHGMIVAAQWLNQNRKWLQDNTAGVLLVEISAGHLERNDLLATEPLKNPEGAGFVTASFNKTLFHADMLLEQFKNEFEGKFNLMTFAYEGNASLTWYLNNQEKFSLLYPFLSDHQLQAIADENVEWDEQADQSFIEFSKGEPFTNQVLLGAGHRVLDSFEVGLGADVAGANELLNRNSKPKSLPSKKTRNLHRLYQSRFAIQDQMRELVSWWEQTLKSAPPKSTSQ